MLENGKMGRLRRVFEVIFGHNVINRHFFRDIRGCLFNVIHGHRPANLDCRITSGDDICYSGRSMIEMLGVLAIIGVLSIGGLAGYSKAMEKFKINKLISEYNMLIFGLIEHKSSFPMRDAKATILSQTALDLGLVPETWKPYSERYIQDSADNLVYINSRTLSSSSISGLPAIVVDFNLGGLTQDENGNDFSANFTQKLCFEMFNSLIYPLHSTLNLGYVFRTGLSNQPFFGDAYCNENRKCLNTMTLSDMKEICASCDGKRRCNVTISF